MDMNRIANTGLQKAADSLFRAAQSIETNSEESLLGVFLLIRILEEKGVIDSDQLSIIAENVLSDMNKTEVETFKAIDQYIENDLK